MNNLLIKLAYQKARQRVAGIYDTVKRMLAIARAQQVSTLSAARQMAAWMLQPHAQQVLWLGAKDGTSSGTWAPL